MTSRKKTLNYAQIWYTAVFEVADDDFAISLSRFIMAVKSSKEALFLHKICIKGFLRSIIKILLLDFLNSKW